MNRIKLTEQDLHILVEDAVKTYLMNEGIDETMMGGLKNVWHGAFGKDDQGQRNWNFNFGQNYRNGNFASSFEKYAQQATQALEGMKTMATSSKNTSINKYLDQIVSNIQNVSQQFSQQATNIANGQQLKMKRVTNPWKQQEMQQDNQYADMLNNQKADYENQLQNQRTDYENQLQGLQNKYGKLNTRFKNYRTKNPASNAAKINRNINARSAVEAADKSTEKVRRKTNVPPEIMKL
jgi:hypothetical protein